MTLIHKPTLEFAGWVALRRPRHGGRKRELELSYRVPRDLWGRGLATEASRAMLAAAFTAHPAERVFAGTAPSNTASRRVLEKIGMRTVAGAPDERADDVEYQILRHHWLLRDGTRRSGNPGGRHRLPDALHGSRGDTIKV